MEGIRSPTSLSSQAATLSFGRAATELVPLVVPIVIVRLIGQADVGLLLGVLEVYYLARLLMTVGFREMTSGSAGPGDEGSGNLKLLAGLALYPLFDLPARIFPNILIVEGRTREAAMVGGRRNHLYRTGVLSGADVLHGCPLSRRGYNSN